MLIARSKNLDDPPVESAGLLEKFLLLLCLIVFVVSLFLGAKNSLGLKYFSPIISGLQSIARVKELHGETSRKTTLDVMWLPLTKGGEIFNFDQLQSELASEVEIQVGEKSVVLAKENTKLRLGLIEGDINFRLSQGEAQVNVLIDQYIRIQRGAEFETLYVKKGYYVIKIDPVFGVQFSSTTAPPKFEKTGKIQNKIAEEKKKKEDVKAKNDKKDGKIDPEQPESTRKKISYDLPQPKDSTVFLGYKKLELIVAAKRTCPDACTLKIFKNHQLWKDNAFKSGEQSVVRIPPSEMSIGIYEWIFATETAEFRSKFVVKDFSDEELFKAIQNKQPVEIQEIR